MKNKQFIRLYHRTRKSPLTLAERIVHAVLVRQLDFAQAASGTSSITGRRIRTITGMSESTIHAALLSLQEKKLAQEKRGYWKAIEPPPEVHGWFPWHAHKEWYRAIAYLKVFLPVPPLTLPESCLLSLLRTGKVNPNRNALAALLGESRITIIRHLKKLENLGFLRVEQGQIIVSGDQQSPPEGLQHCFRNVGRETQDMILFEKAPAGRIPKEVEPKPERIKTIKEECRSRRETMRNDLLNGLGKLSPYHRKLIEVARRKLGCQKLRVMWEHAQRDGNHPKQLFFSQVQRAMDKLKDLDIDETDITKYKPNDRCYYEVRIQKFPAFMSPAELQRRIGDLVKDLPAYPDEEEEKRAIYFPDDAGGDFLVDPNSVEIH